MKIFHKDFLEFEIPDGWKVDENETVSIYNEENGDGAITFSFYNVLGDSRPLYQIVSVMKKKYVEENNISVPKISLIKEDDSHKLETFDEGTTHDGWFFKMYVVAKYPRIVFATYYSENRTQEIGVIDRIIKSMKFCF